MLKIVDVSLTPDSIVELFPVVFNREGDDFLVGRLGTGSFVAVNPGGVRAITMMQKGWRLGEIKQRLNAKSRDEDVRLRGFLETLIGAGLVRSIGGQAVAVADRKRVPTLGWIRSDQIAWLFHPAMLAIYAVVVIAGAALLAVHPAYVPTPRGLLIRQSPILTALIVLAMTWANVAKHEAAHIVAGRFLGVNATWSLSRRLFFPVIQTDLTDLWSVPRRRRYVAYVAGMVSDLLLAAVIVITLWTAERLAIAVGPDIVAALRLLLLLACAGLLWQFNFFLRTDMYYIATNALGCRNLAADARAYLAAVVHRRPATDRSWTIRLYAIVSLVGTAVFVAVGLVYVMGLVFASASRPPVMAASRGINAIGLLATTALLAGSLIIERRTVRLRYRVITPVDL